MVVVDVLVDVVLVDVVLVVDVLVDVVLVEVVEVLVVDVLVDVVLVDVVEVEVVDVVVKNVGTPPPQVPSVNATCVRVEPIGYVTVFSIASKVILGSFSSIHCCGPTNPSHSVQETYPFVLPLVALYT